MGVVVAPNWWSSYDHEYDLMIGGTVGIYGQDWASYQSDQPPTGGLEFVFIKVSQGLHTVNSHLVAQTGHARAEGLQVGFYHYPEMGNDPTAELAHFRASLGNLLEPGDIIALDWEGYDPENQLVPMARQIAYKADWLAQASTLFAAHRVGTYCNEDYLGHDPHGSYGAFLWIATAGRRAGDPGISGPWLFHQYGDKPVDKDYCPLTRAQLTSWAFALEDDFAMLFANQQQFHDAVKQAVIEGVASQPARDAVAYAELWWWDHALHGTIPQGASKGQAQLLQDLHAIVASLRATTPPHAAAAAAVETAPDAQAEQPVDATEQAPQAS